MSIGNIETMCPNCSDESDEDKVFKQIEWNLLECESCEFQFKIKLTWVRCCTFCREGGIHKFKTVREELDNVNSEYYPSLEERLRRQGQHSLLEYLVADNLSPNARMLVNRALKS